MKKIILLLLVALIAPIASAVVVITPSTVPYGFQVLPGSTRQPYVQIAGGTLNTVNWSVISGDVTVSSPNNINTALVTFGPSTGTCSMTGALGSAHTVASTRTAVVRATSGDDSSVHYDFTFNVCSSLSTAMTIPAFQEAFIGQAVGVQSFVLDPDEEGTWAVSGTGCSLSDSDKPQCHI